MSEANSDESKFNELLSCPFCGGSADIDCDATKDITWSIDNAQIACNECGAATEINWCDPLDKESCKKCVVDTISLWNKRAV